MPRKRIIIDFEIIWKKINGSLTQEEDQLFSEWLNESSSHKRYFENAKRYYSGNSYENPDTDKAWRLLPAKLQQKKTRLKVLLPVLFAAATLFVVFYFLAPPEKKPVIQIAGTGPANIIPGSSQAQLILDDGSVIDLSTSKELQLKEGGAEIQIDGAKIKYSETERNNEIKYNSLYVPRGGEYYLELSDGSKVWLNSETTLRYPARFDGKERKVELTGEAFFIVAENKMTPFVVVSQEQSLKVLGTEFNINSYTDSPVISTTLVKGRVEISFVNKPGIATVLLPNEQSSINRTEKKIISHKVDTYKYTAWKEGRFVFEDQTLEEIMSTVSRWYNVDVVFTRDELRNVRFTGNLPRYISFDDLINKIKKTNEVKFTVEERNIIIG